MSLKVTFELSDKDLRFFRNVMREAREKARHRDEASILEAARKLLARIEQSGVPVFVKERLNKIGPMIEMLRDQEWQLKGEDRERVLSALAYFNEPQDLIPDHVPGFGYMDDAIMVQLVVEELRHELEAYADFCSHRKEVQKRAARTSPEEREKLLAAKRDALQARMRRRRRARVRAHGRRSSRAPFTLW